MEFSDFDLTNTYYTDIIYHGGASMLVNHISVGGSMSSSPEHHHSNFELILNLKGCGVMTIENSDYSFQPGTVILCPPGFVHRKFSENGFKDIYIRFDEPFLNPEAIITYDDSEHKTVKTLLYQALRYYNLRNTGYNEIINSIAKLIITIITFEKNIKKQSPIVENLKNKIIENYYNTDFNFDKIYDKMSYNSDYIRRCFKKEMNITPAQYLTNIRIDNALNLMVQDPGMNISDIAYACGYNDALYFSKVFRKHKGISPTDYIKKHLEDIK